MAKKKSDVNESTFQVEAEELGQDGTFVLLRIGETRRPKLIKRGKRCLAIWEGGWRELCPPHYSWERVAEILHWMEH